MGWGNEKFFKIYGLAYVTKMAAMPIYGKNPSKIFLKTNRLMTLKLGIQIWDAGPSKVYSNDDPVLTLTIFMARSNFVSSAFIWGILKHQIV